MDLRSARPVFSHLHSGLPSTPLFDPLEQRSLLSAPPQTSDLRLDTDAIVVQVPTTISVLATDDVGVRGVSFFLDRNDNALWEPGVDQPLGDRFVPDQDGRYRLSITADASWPLWSRIRADAVDAEDQWTGALATTTIYPTDVPRIIQLDVRPMPVVDIPGYITLKMTAVVADATQRGALAEGVTFFFDIDRNGRWDAGVDQDLGYTREMDNFGNFVLTTRYPLLGYETRIVAAAAKSSSNLLTNPWGPVRTTLPGRIYDVPRIRSVVADNLSLDGGENQIQIGDTVRFTIEAEADQDLLAVTGFYDSNYNGRWDAGVDRHLGEFFFAPDVLAGRARIIVNIQSWMNFDYRAFVFAAKDRSTDRGDSAWSSTFSKWINIKSQAWVENIVAPNVSTGSPVTFTFNARDDHGVRGFVAWIDLNRDGYNTPDEIFTEQATRLSGSLLNGRWQMTLDMNRYGPGQYTIAIEAFDFEGTVRVGRLATTTFFAV